MYEPWSLDAAAGRSVAPARFWPVVAAARGRDAPRPRRSASGRGAGTAPPPQPPPGSVPQWPPEMRPARHGPMNGSRGCVRVRGATPPRRAAAGPPGAVRRARSPQLTSSNRVESRGEPNGFALTIVGETIIVHAAAIRIPGAGSAAPSAARPGGNRRVAPAVSAFRGA